MTFAALILRNLRRQRVRTILTAVGISVGITTVVALGSITAGLKTTMGDLVRAGGSDFMVAQAGSSDLSFSIVPEEVVAAVEARPDVERATGMMLEVAEVGSNPYFLLFGYDPADLPAQELRLLAGRLVAGDGEALLGADAAGTIGAGVGDVVELERRPFRVVGVYRTGDKLRDGGAIVPLDVVQRVASRENVVTAAFVTVTEGADPDAVADAIERDIPTLAAIAGIDEYAEVDQGVQILDALTLAISILAVGIGAIGVMNTMVMSVFERTRELGILRAVGWRGSRVAQLVIGESLVLCLLASVVGVLLGIAATRAVLLVPAVEAFLEPTYPPSIFVRALGVAVAVALAGAAYPVVRAVRLRPLEALRHE